MVYLLIYYLFHFMIRTLKSNELSFKMHNQSKVFALIVRIC